MLQLLLAASLSVAHPVPAAVAFQPDSIVAQRLVDTMPKNGVRRVPLVKKNAVKPGPLLDGIAQRLTESGFFQLSPAAITAACGANAMTGLRLAIRVYENGALRELEIPDTCGGGSPALRQQLSEMCGAALDVLRAQVLPRRSGPSAACTEQRATGKR